MLGRFPSRARFLPLTTRLARSGRVPRDAVQTPVALAVYACKRGMHEGWHEALLLRQECLAVPSQVSGVLLQTATDGTDAARYCPLAMTHLPDVAAFLDKGLRGELIGYVEVS